jgi:hypothetical protein
MCSRIVMTPLWTDRPKIMSDYSVKDETALTPEQIADSMIELIQEGKYSGGTVLMHDVPKKEVVFPGVAGMDLSNVPQTVLDVIAKTAEPIKEIMKGERGKG